MIKLFWKVDQLIHLIIMVFLMLHESYLISLSFQHIPYLYVFFFLNKNINITKCLKAISDLLFIISFIYFSINSAVGFDPLF
jgi:hypothetical protein